MTGNKRLKKIANAVIILGGVFGLLEIVIKVREKVKQGSEINISVDLRNDVINIPKKETDYEKIWKPFLDKVLSFIGLVCVLPLLIILAMVVFIDDPGPIFFVQERIGKDKKLFKLHKFRSMKMSTPHNVPTHQLENPEQYITNVGRFLRKYSLDELPQMWDIFVGNMSIIGPRPALWNQDDLIAERDKYGANDIKPGLTGWAQVNGRDELEIEEKAKLDGEYVKCLKQGGMKALFFDMKCFFGTFHSVVCGRGVVEGGTGELSREKTVKAGSDSGRHVENSCIMGCCGKKTEEAGVIDRKDAGFEEYGFLKHFDIDLSEKNQKKVLVTGAGSYIGESFGRWAKGHYPANLTIDTLDMQDSSWREKDFSPYDTVFHVAGIAHADVGKVSEEEKKRYYAVNTDLAIETAGKAKAEGVRQFILMSSMIIYGDSAPYGKEKVIGGDTLPAPANFYGDSKWQADKGVRALADGRFRVAVLRPPMVYGEGSKGNYPVLVKLAKRLPVFPDVENRRSMLYIDKLCEFLCKLVLSGEGGIYFPQNREYTKTSEMVREIAEASGKKIWVTKLFNPAVWIGRHIPGKISGLVDKAFGSYAYSQELSRYAGLDYQTVSLKNSIKAKKEGADAGKNFNGTGSEGTKGRPVHILVVSQYFYPETFRINDMAAEWVKRGYQVTVLTGIPNYPMGRFYDGYGYRSRRRERWNGVDIIRIPLIPRGSNSIGMAANYLSFVISGWWWVRRTEIRADLVYTFEVSPMTQALVGVGYAKRYYVPHYLYVTDLWPENVESVTGIHNKAVINLIRRMVNYIYENTNHILTCSQSFVGKIHEQNIDVEKIEYWPQYAEDFYKPMERRESLLPQDGILNLAFAGNVGYAQGLDILVEAAEKLRKENILVRFNIIGDGRYLTELQERVKKGKVSGYFNFISRQPAEKIPEYLAYADALLITLSKSDVFSITIPAKTQSCMACGRPILVSADGEIQNIIREANAGLCSDAEDIEGFVENIKMFMDMSIEQRERLSSNALLYSQTHFNKKKLLDRLDEIFLT